MKTTAMAILVAATVLGGALASGAADKAKGGPGEGASVGGPRLGRLAKRLGLSDEQVKALREADEARKKAVQPLREKLKDELKSLRGLVQEKEADSKVQASLERVKQLHASIRTEREKFQAQLESALTPTQRAKLLMAMVHRRGARGPRRGE